MNNAESLSNILMVAFHFPPCKGSSGLQRTLSFSRYLSEWGWRPFILTAHARAYPDRGNDQLADIPSGMHVERAQAFDTARHFAIGGRYLGWMGLPDRWSSWSIAAIVRGFRLIRRYRPRIIWSTYPIASAHVIALVLHRLTGVPWIADFRDPMTEGDLAAGYRLPEDPTLWKVRRWIERQAVASCARAVFVAPGTLRMYKERYPGYPDDKWVLIPNGYDEESFLSAEKLAVPSDRQDGPIVLLHSGILYPASGDRHPGSLFAALAALRDAGRISPGSVKVVLRATGFDQQYQNLIEDYGIRELVCLEPAIAYREALAEMITADALIIFQGSVSNPNIPAKLYEYVRARRPILALVDPEGDTAEELKAAGVGKVAPLDQPVRIAECVMELLDEIRGATAPITPMEVIKRYSRQSRTEELARLLNAVSQGGCKEQQSASDEDERLAVR